ncbi:hypothetical protein BH11PLA2_BH11PLA2_04920 [soil metagenome]
MQFPAIILFCVLSAIVYGILHDLVTAHVCVEYFTIGHPPVFDTNDPVLLALGWGFLATWWVGVILGMLLALSAQMGSWPKRNLKSLIRPILTLFVISYIAAMMAGITGYVLGINGIVFLINPFDTLIAPNRHARFLFDMWAHLTSYSVGALGGLIVCIRVAISRQRM